MIGFKWDIVPPAHDRLNEVPGTAFEAKPRMGTVGNYGIIGMNLTTIRAAKSDHLVATLQQESHVEFCEETATGLLCAFEQQMIKRTAIAHQCDILWARYHDFV